MKLLPLVFVGFLSVMGSALAQTCPNGIPSANNPGCIPPDDPLSPYYQGSEEEPRQAQQSPPEPTGYWEKTWGAIAPSPKGGVLGTALGASSKEQAERLALADCKAKGGGGCKVGMTYRNQCAVMVLGNARYFTASAASLDEAKDEGIQYCQEKDTNCRVYYTACTEPIYHQY